MICIWWINVIVWDDEGDYLLMFLWRWLLVTICVVNILKLNCDIVFVKINGSYVVIKKIV